MQAVTQTFTTEIAHPPQRVWDWHARPGAFLRLAPPWEELTLIEGDQGLDVGARTIFSVKKGPISVRWEAEHTACDPGTSFVDEQRRGPFASWRHEHRFEPTRSDTCILRDEVVWSPPGGLLGRVAIPSLRAANERMFTFRHRRTERDLDRHAPYLDRPRLRVAITGVTGLVGSALAAFLTTGGHQVVRVVRRDPRPGDCLWDPAKAQIDHEALAGVDAIVHLAGASVAERWTPTHKQAIRESRVQGTRLIVDAIRRLSPRPKVLVSASAIGFYGDRGDEELTEESEPGEGFLAEVGKAWEAASAPVTELGVRRVVPRIGIVTTAAGGVLGRLLPIFRSGAGGPVGSGTQWISWIDLDDLVGLIHCALFEESWSGPFNAVGPQPIQQRDQARILGEVLRRPAFAAAPAFAIKAALGEMGETLLLGGQRVIPSRLQAMGFRFDEVDFGDAVAHNLGLR